MRLSCNFKMAVLGGCVVTVCLVLPAVLTCGEDGGRLAQDLFKTMGSFPSEVIPQREGPLPVFLKYSFENIVSADIGINQVEVLLLQTAMWSNREHVWDPEEYGMCGHIVVPIHSTWLPDITIEDGAAEIVSPNNVKVTNEGHLTWKTRQRMRFSCDLQNLTSLSGTTCRIQLGSWSYTKQELSLRLLDPGEVITSSYSVSSRYKLMNASLEASSYELPAGQYEKITLVFSLRDKTVDHDIEPGNNDSIKNTASLVLVVCHVVLFNLFSFFLTFNLAP